MWAVFFIIWYFFYTFVAVKSLRIYITAFFLTLITLSAWSAADDPILEPYVEYSPAREDPFEKQPGDEVEPQNAPLNALFHANPSNVEGAKCRYMWTVLKNNTEFLMRDDENLGYTFMESGIYTIILKATIVRDGIVYNWPDDYGGSGNVFLLTITESHLEFPNAFSPNGDGTNDYLQAKGTAPTTSSGGNGPKGIVDFEAVVFNRWGQKLYSWTDCYTYEAGWDGTYGGKTVKDGVYFLRVKAKGADGVEYNIKKAINVLTGYTENHDNSAGNP